MKGTPTQQIAALRRMTVGELRDAWFRLYGEHSRSRNRDFLFRRLAWRVQELAHGGLSERAKQRIDALAPGDFVRARVPDMAAPGAGQVDAAQPPARRRDPRLPSPGTVITRLYRGRELRLLVRDDGFEIDGTCYGSLSEAARAVTGQHWSGPLFWGLRQRKRKS